MATEDLERLYYDYKEKCMREGVPVMPLREFQVQYFIERGLSNKDIGLTLHLTEKTVKAHVARLMKRMGIRRRVDILIYCKDQQIRALEAQMTELRERIVSLRNRISNE